MARRLNSIAILAGFTHHRRSSDPVCAQEIGVIPRKGYIELNEARPSLGLTVDEEGLKRFDIIE